MRYNINYAGNYAKYRKSNIPKYTPLLLLAICLDKYKKNKKTNIITKKTIR